MVDKNQTLYSTRRIAQYYAQLRRLQPAEQTILALLQSQLPGMRMLDIGVGGGRTTQHFSPLVKQYVGVDYAATMVAACQKRFPSASPALQFAVCDARDMSQFSDDSFDLILFSFNGIDYSSHGDRFKIFQEVSRVGKSGGYFCFSSHNLQAMEREFNWRTQVCLNPVVTYTNLMMLALLRLFNRSLTLTQLQTSTHATLVDESHNFQLETYYIRPQAQVHQLQSNFDHIRLFSWKSGLEITDENQWGSNTDMWLYYLCTIK